MACTNPLKAFVIGINKDTGKNKLKICSRDVTYVEKDYNSWIKHYDSIPPDIQTDRLVSKFDYIPCGSCLSCRLSYARDWSVRIMCEAQLHDCNYFITLTYDDDTLPYNVDSGSGEFSGKSSLVKRDLQNFFKRLRKNYSHDNELRFYGIGEYSPVRLRPHYHSIIFGLELDDLVYYRSTDLGYDIYTSDFLQRCWSHQVPADAPFDYVGSNGHHYKYNGFVFVAGVSWESASYVARYCMKKINDFDPGLNEKYLIQREFTNMSLKPGIGKDYYELHKDHIYKYDAIYFPDGKVVKPPKYFDVLYEREFPSLFAELKEKRKYLADVQRYSAISQTDYDFDDFLIVQDTVLKAKTKSLQRKEI